MVLEEHQFIFHATRLFIKFTHKKKQCRHNQRSNIIHEEILPIVEQDSKENNQQCNAIEVNQNKKSLDIETHRNRRDFKRTVDRQVN